MENKTELTNKLKELIYNYPMSRAELSRISGVKRRTVDSALSTGNVSAKSWKMLFKAVKHSFAVIALVDEM